MDYPHWHYFISLDSDLEASSRFVEICEDNKNTYSIEYVRIFLAACSEIDVVAKLLSLKFNPEFKPSHKKFPTIIDYQKAIIQECPNFHTTKILAPRYGLELTPWETWKKGKTPPFWWNHYNNVKHERNNFFKEANLNNTIHAVAGLFVMVLYLYSYKSKLKKDSVPLPKLLSVDKFHENGAKWHYEISYITPDDPK